MFYINNESLLFDKNNIKRIEEVKNAKYVCDTEYKSFHVAVFYGDIPHPVSNSRYFALYYYPDKFTVKEKLMITNGAFIEDQDITGVVANNGEIIYSRYRHDYRVSTDGSVFIDGGRDYTRTNTIKTVLLKVKDGVLYNTTDENQLVERIVTNEN
jgi:hypothetical protein